MKRLIALGALMIFIYSPLHAQVSVSLSMRKLIDSDQNNAKEMFVLVKGDVISIKEFVEAHKGIFLNSAGDIASVKLSVASIAELMNAPFVRTIGSDIHHYRTMNDTMRMLTHVNEVHAGQTPLMQPYRGTNILMGIIDSGLDLTHPDFQDSTGKTRVKWLWDMNLNSGGGTVPSPYNYGRQFSAQQIDSGLASAHTGTDQYGHGTYVTGIAAGNGRAVGHFEGVATASDLIIVAYNFTAQDTVSRMAHAVEYIFNKAQQLGKPVVINASLGDYYGSHDGMDLESQYISYLINQQPGRIVVAAAGNIGANYPYHINRNSTNGDTMFTWVKYNSAYPGCYMQLFADTADLNQVTFSVGADEVTPIYNLRGQTAYFSIASSINNVVNRTLFNGPNRIGRIQTYTTINDGVYSVEIYIIPDSTSYYWRLFSTGNGHYDSWTWDYNITGVPTAAQYPDMVRYLAPDTLSSLVSGIACLDNVITVANFDNTDRHIDIDSALQVMATDHPGQLGPNSGRGPTRDGRIKPDIAAPGNHILSAGVASLIPGLTHNKIALGGMHITGGGTSASSPVVAGIAALYLEANPGAGWQNVKAAITNCAQQDSLTWGPYPNNAWGFGKVNAFEALTTCSMNVGVSDGDHSLAINIYPNPSDGLLNITFDNDEEVIVCISDLTGRRIGQRKVVSETTINTKEMSDGVYILQAESASGKTITRKFAVSK